MRWVDSRDGWILERWVAKKVDGWLRREMGGDYGGRWVAKNGNGWLRRKMGGYWK